ncbi:DNA-directed RNA polymerase subunit beta [Rickettsiales endosymbiont of Paramecium tredecaurelia]|uniref:DNA-directed RNA polymerase subunit beta n=1 Tax=Candidatus Sarmatiella mevalonica TaxID=2770581 RepID=UPI001920C306|nr:DNA-directed RNA polymerase subunit beta [Candidatus Sarmatiella mevalonica]MBL3284703.1 DNA-directed RNA polymerase subunit beta [Candidatus Sarmatiella mevalonica]
MRVRKNFGKNSIALAIPNLIDIQKTSYQKTFLQMGVNSEERLDIGVQQVLKSVFPISDPHNRATLDFVKYEFGPSKYDIEEAKQRKTTYYAPLKALLRLTIWSIDPVTQARGVKSIKEQEVYIGDVPLMTESGTFIINGTERVIVSQLHRSAGVFFYHDNGKNHASGKLLYFARIIPHRGSWIDFEFDTRDILFFRIDRKRKMYATVLLKALGMSNNDIISYFYPKMAYELIDGKWTVDFIPDLFKNQKLGYDLIDARNGELLLSAGNRMTPKIIKRLSDQGVTKIIAQIEELEGKFLAQDLVDSRTNEVLTTVGQIINQDITKVILKLGLKKVEVLALSAQSEPYLRNTMFADKTQDSSAALTEIFKVMRPGEPATPDAGRALLHSLFFDHDRYDLSAVGRIKTNKRLNLDIPESTTVLTHADIKDIIKALMDLKDGRGKIDDIDNLGNRRLRSAGELVENQFRLGVLRMGRSVVEKMSNTEVDLLMPNDLVNPKLLVAVLKEFFGTSQSSQFMDQTNPLSEVTHKRRMSALGPGGLSRDRAAFEARDVHPTHYGRICPVETPEGQNIGLINSMAIFARTNKYGFIESPYRKVVDGVITDEVYYLSADDEARYKIGQANVRVDEQNKIIEDLVNCRIDNGDFVKVPPCEVDFVDVAPMQVVSVATSMIPFLENDDANRALMGSNMQRQAVPLLRSEAPIVGTGIEHTVAKDSGTSVVALHDGVVEYVDATRIIVSYVDQDHLKDAVDVYNLSKFRKSNHNTCINQKPLVRVGQIVKVGDILADGPSTERGEIALGKNILVAFLPWNGYTFEDSIVISERIVKEDVYTSIHIEEFEVIARDTRLGPEEITRDIPNASEENLRQLDETGIVYIGAEVKPGDVLVGKVTPKSESLVTPEEKLLRAIFGEKAADVKDSSLHVPPGIYGTVVEVRVFVRRGVDKDERAQMIELQQIASLARDRDDQIHILESFTIKRIKRLLAQQVYIAGLKNVEVGKALDETFINSLSKTQVFHIQVQSEEVSKLIQHARTSYEEQANKLKDNFNQKVEKIRSGDDLPSGALKVVKVFVATKHKLQAGDKMAGRHGNKGVVSRIVPVEDMPYLEDGTVIDIILNPLGLPSRMNIGQILETHLGWALKSLGVKMDRMLQSYRKSEIELEQVKEFLRQLYHKNSANIDVDTLSDQELLNLCYDSRSGVYCATPVFDGAKISDIKQMLELAEQDQSAQVRLIDGRTGEYFDRPVTVGYNYLLKLHHLVDDKIHARSIGPYSLVTQQPLGGKAHFGGQRVGEMECWAFQAYGASRILREMLTVKSDSPDGRVKIYRRIIAGEYSFDEYGTPGSFGVMLGEIRALALNMGLENGDLEQSERKVYQCPINLE